MKKVKILGVAFFCLLLMTGCSNNRNERAEQKEVKVVESSVVSSTKDTASQTDSNATKTTETTTKSEVKKDVPDTLTQYSDDQIEYARIWLVTMGERFTRYMNESNFDFDLNVGVLKAGSLVNTYEEQSVRWPNDVMILSGKHEWQSSVVYSSNDNGTINRYAVPLHWHYSDDDLKDKDFIRRMTQKVLDNPTVISIPAGDPELVKRLIDLEKINF